MSKVVTLTIDNIFDVVNTSYINFKNKYIGFFFKYDAVSLKYVNTALLIDINTLNSSYVDVDGSLTSDFWTNSSSIISTTGKSAYKLKYEFNSENYLGFFAKIDNNGKISIFNHNLPIILNYELDESTTSLTLYSTRVEGQPYNSGCNKINQIYNLGSMFFDNI